MAKTRQNSCIYVLAGTNGAGKSSVAGAAFAASGAEYFNPDEAAKKIRAANPHMTSEESNAAAWQLGLRLLKQAISEQLSYAFETTLGGNTITSLLEQALDVGIQVRMKYVGLASPELHIARVQARVARGGHDIPEEKIRERFHRSRLNLIRLSPKLTELLVYDNSVDTDPYTGTVPNPMLVLHLRAGKVAKTCNLAQVPDWAKPIVLAALSSTRI